MAAAVPQVGVDVIDEVDARALTEYMTVLEDIGRVRGADDLYLVVSGSGKEYLVDLRGEPSCDCPDHEYRGRRCKHIRRTLFAIGAQPVPSWVDRDDVDPQLGEHTSADPIWRGER